MVLQTKKYICAYALILGICAIYWSLGITCPVLLLTGWMCPTCGTTRALLALMRCDVQMYLYYQPLAIPLVIAVMLCIYFQVSQKPLKGFSAVFIAATLFANTIQYISRAYTIICT